MNSDERLLCILSAKVRLCLFVYICRRLIRQGRGVRNEGRIEVLLCICELEVHSFLIAKQLLCLPGFHMFTESKG